MFFFKNDREDSELTAKRDSLVEKRGKPRYSVSPQFHLNVTLAVQPGPNGDTQPADAGTPQGWSWKCRLLDCSEQGVRVQLEPSLKIPAGELRGLRLKVEEYGLNAPCRIANIGEQDGRGVFGLMLDLENEATFDAYWRLLETVVVGSSLKLHSKAAKPDESGYLVEHYASNRPARLSIWRHPDNQGIVAFEFRLKRHVMRAVVGNNLECLSEPGDHPVPSNQQVELLRLFSGMASNLTQAVAPDVRELLQHYKVTRDEREDLKRHTA
jgi:hypothetical protein